MRQGVDRFFDHVNHIGVVPDAVGGNDFTTDTQSIDGISGQLIADQQRSLVIGAIKQAIDGSR